SDDNFDRTFRLCFPEHYNYLGCNPAQIDALVLHLFAVNPRKLQKIIDQHSHFIAGATDPLQMIMTLRRDVTAELFIQDGTETVDVTQRGAQVMRYSIAESFKFPDRSLKLGSAPGNFLLKVCIKAFNVMLSQPDISKIFAKTCSHVIERKRQFAKFAASDKRCYSDLQITIGNLMRRLLKLFNAIGNGPLANNKHYRKRENNKWQQCRQVVEELAVG